MAVFFVELWTVLLYFSLTDGSAEIQLVLPLSNPGFFNKLRIVLIIRFAILGPLSVNRE